MKISKLFINGKWVESNSNEYIKVENPATKEIIAEVVAANEVDVDEAVKGAKIALKTWKHTTINERIEYVKKIGDYFKENLDEITETVISELGSVVKTSKEVHVNAYLNNLDDYLRIAKNYEQIDHYDGYDVYKEPVGVVACITPWNFPFGQIAKKVFPALLMGNTIVLKPSQRTPLTALYFAKACEKINLPPGVFQLVTGRGSEVGNALAKHKDVNMISFTGSTDGGKELSQIGFESIKRLALELGGKSAAIFLKDTDYKKYIPIALNNVMPNTGQACSSKTRFVVPIEDKEIFEKIVVESTKNFIVGEPLDKNVDIGPLQSQKQFDKVQGYIELGKKEETLLYEGTAPNLPGYYVAPVVFTDVSPDAKIAQEEIFGPVVVIHYYEKIEEAIEIANNSIYGLHGMIFGDSKTALEIAREIDTGQIQINDSIRTHNAPFGGFKQSGIGREGGIYGLEEYIELKTIFN